MNSVAANSVDEAAVKLGERAADCPILWYKPRPKALPFHLDCEHRTRFAVGGKQSTKTYSSQAEIVMAMSGIEDEEAFDRIAEGYTLQGHAERIRCRP